VALYFSLLGVLHAPLLDSKGPSYDYYREANDYFLAVAAEAVL
jgi:hypothetical protein